MNKGIGKRIAKLWAIQLSLLLSIVVCLWWFNSIVARSVLMGGLIYWVPNVYFTFYAFRDGQSLTIMLSNIYRGEFGKLLLTATGFVITFVLVKPIDFIVLFTAFVGMTVIQLWLLSHWQSG